MKKLILIISIIVEFSNVYADSIPQTNKAIFVPDNKKRADCNVKCVKAYYDSGEKPSVYKNCYLDCMNTPKLYEL